MPLSAHQTPTDTTDDLEEVLSTADIKSLKQKSVSGALSYFMRTAVLQGIGLVSAFILSAFFSPEDYGVYGYVTQVIGLLIFFSDIGLAASLVQKKNEPSLKDYRTVFTVQQILSWLIVLVAIMVGSSSFIQQKVGPTGNWILLALAISFPLASLKTISSIKLERKLQFSKLVFPQILEQISFHGILIALAWKGYGAMAYTWAILVRSIVGTVAMLFTMPWKIGFQLDRKSLKNLLGFGAKFQLNDLLARIKDQLYFLALGQFFSLKEFGYIQWSKNWSMYPYNLTVQNVMSITFPTFSRLQKYPDLLKKALEKSLFFISLSIFPILVGMSVLINPLTQVIGKYNKWQPAVFSFILFALSVSWSAISTPLVNTLNAIGQINKSLKLMVIWTILTWVISPITIYFFGLNGVALAALLISFTSILSIKYVKEFVAINVWEQIWRQLLAGMVMAGVGLAMQPFLSSSLKFFLIGGFVLGLSYLLALFLIGYKKIVNETKSLFSK